MEWRERQSFRIEWKINRISETNKYQDRIGCNKPQIIFQKFRKHIYPIIQKYIANYLDFTAEA